MFLPKIIPQLSTTASKHSRNILGVALGLLIISTSETAFCQTFRVDPPSWSKSEITLDPNPPLPITLPSSFAFVHPMTVMNPSELEEVRRRVEEKLEPQTSAFDKVLEAADKSMGIGPKPPEGMLTVMGGYEPGSNLGKVRKLFGDEARAAYASALVYAITGDTKYGDNAVRYLNAWAKAAPSFNGMDAGLQLGSYLSGMLFAADLLHDYAGWSPEDRKSFEAWWREKILPHTKHVTYLGNNWGDAGLLGIMAASVVFEDRELLTEALNRLQEYFHTSLYSRTPENPEWKIAPDGDGAHLPAESNRKTRGIVYHNYALTTLVQCLEIARYAGVDFWNRRTQSGSTIPDVIGKVHGWDFLNADYPQDPDSLRGYRKIAADNIYELVLNQGLGTPEIQTWISQNRPALAACSDLFSTVTKGDMPVSYPAAKGEEPKNISGIPTSTRSIQLRWDSPDPKTALGVVIEKASTPDGEWKQVATVALPKSDWIDPTREPGSTAYYRLRSYAHAGDSPMSGVLEVATPKEESISIFPGLVQISSLASLTGADIVPQANGTNEIFVTYANRTPTQGYEGPDLWAGWKAMLESTESAQLKYPREIPGFIPAEGDRLTSLNVTIRATNQEVISRKGESAFVLLFELPNSYALAELTGATMGFTLADIFGGQVFLTNRLLAREKETGKLFVSQQGFRLGRSRERNDFREKTLLFSQQRWHKLDSNNFTLSEIPVEGPKEIDALGLFADGKFIRAENEKPLNLVWIARWIPNSLTILKTE